MRTLLTVLSVSLLVGAGFGCGDDTTTTTTADLAVGADMSATPHDMMQLNCKQILDCASNASSTSAATACIAEAKSTSAPKFQAVFGCAFAACGPVDGGGTGMCTMVGDTSQTCLGCVTNVIGAGEAGGGACANEVAACNADT